MSAPHRLGSNADTNRRRESEMNERAEDLGWPVIVISTILACSAGILTGFFVAYGEPWMIGFAVAAGLVALVFQLDQISRQIASCSKKGRT